MARVDAAAIRAAYCTQLLKDGEEERALALNEAATYSPISTLLTLHPEDEPSLKAINTHLVEIGLDILIANNEIAAAGTAYTELLSDVKQRLEAVDRILLTEECRLQDMNMLCGQNTDICRVVALSADDFSGRFSTDGEATFMLYATSAKAVDLTVVAVAGNGYEGNDYVYHEGKFLKEVIDTSDRALLCDESDTTAYEYSRLTVDPASKAAHPQLNRDDREAQCAIVLYGQEAFNIVKIASDMECLRLLDVLVSDDDGATYTSVLKHAIELHNRLASYSSADYIYGSGLIAFPSTRYLKLVFSSDGASQERIAFRSPAVSAGAAKDAVEVVDGARRRVVRINHIEAKTSKFVQESTLKTGNLVDDPVESIAIFANEYIPAHFPADNCFSYVLTVNGTDYPIIPINSQTNGVKVIRKEESGANEYTRAIGEAIKSAYLTVKIHSSLGNQTPFLSSVKVCYGRAVDANV